jgi:hypothetical protein
MEFAVGEGDDIAFFIGRLALESGLGGEGAPVERSLLRESGRGCKDGCQ